MAFLQQSVVILNDLFWRWVVMGKKMSCEGDSTGERIRTINLGAYKKKFELYFNTIWGGLFFFNELAYLLLSPSIYRYFFYASSVQKLRGEKEKGRRDSENIRLPLNYINNNIAWAW